MWSLINQMVEIMVGIATMVIYLALKYWKNDHIAHHLWLQIVAVHRG